MWRGKDTSEETTMGQWATVRAVVEVQGEEELRFLLRFLVVLVVLVLLRQLLVHRLLVLAVVAAVLGILVVVSVVLAVLVAVVRVEHRTPLPALRILAVAVEVAERLGLLLRVALVGAVWQ
jgi:hypothetical protein